MTSEKIEDIADAKTKPPKVFISYSWTSPDHQKRILEWAELFVRDGVDVILDKWYLKEGQDKNAFMEKMVTDKEVTKVLIFSEKTYAEKADARKGGVGTESQIISQEIYEKVTQEKFLPVVCETDVEGKPFLPVFLKSRIYFDFSNAEAFHENYEKLLRAIFNKPLYTRPALGKPPEFVTAEEKPYRWSRPLLQSFKDSVLQDRPSYKGYAAAFLNTFEERLEEFRISPQQGKEFDDLVVASIEAFLPFRDDFIEFLKIVITYKNEESLYAQIASFFEKCIRYQYPPRGVTSWNETWFDNFRFFLCELFLYLIGLLIKNQKLNEVQLFTDRFYYLPEEASYRNDRMARFSVFRSHCASLEQIRKERLKLNRLSIVADLIKSRASSKDVTFNDLMQAECVLFVKSLISKNLVSFWYPQILVFTQYSSTFELFARAAVKSEFAKLKTLFSVSTKDEFIQKITEAIDKHNIRSWEIFLYGHIDLDQLLGFKQLDSLG